MAKSEKNRKEKKGDRNSENRPVKRSGIGLMGNGIDYGKYQMSAKEKMVGWLAGAVVSFLVIWLVTHKGLVSIVTGAVAGMFFIPVYEKKCKARREKELLLQFRDLMESLVASYSAGSNPVDAFAASYRDMVDMYGDESCIARETHIINAGLANGFTINALLGDFAERTGMEDIKNFVDVFCICCQKGGDMHKVLFDTRMVINEKIEMEQDMKVQLRSNMNELKVLIVVPVIIDFMFQGDGAFGAAGNSAGGFVARLVAVLLFIGAYMMGRYLLGRVENDF